MENTQIYLSVGSVQTYRWNDERVTLQLLLLLRLFIESHLLDFYMNIFFITPFHRILGDPLQLLHFRGRSSEEFNVIIYPCFPLRVYFLREFHELDSQT